MAIQWQITDKAEEAHVSDHDCFCYYSCPYRKAEERTTTCNVAHERELWRRKGGRIEHLRASFDTCIAVASPFQKSHVVAVCATVAIISY